MTLDDIADVRASLTDEECAELDMLLDWHPPDSPLPDHAALAWREWITRHFGHFATRPFAPRHERLWEWFDALTPGIRPQARVEVWPRGGAKSSTGELGCVRVGVKLSRRFALYVCGTQEQANDHVQSIAAAFERIGVGRAVNKYGHSRGWRRDQLRTENGFNVAGLGLDVAVRGVKLDQYRPDLLLFDDVDNQDDSPETVGKKIRAITTAILPAEAPDCAALFLQNLIHEEGIVSRLVDGRADFLYDRQVCGPEPAVVGLRVELEPQADGRKIYRISGGEPTWAGQDIETCQHQINTWGYRAFLREAQHEVRGADGFYFNVDRLTTLDSVPDGLLHTLRFCRAWDLAATEGGGDYTSGVLMGLAPNGCLYVLDVVRGQWGTDRVLQTIERTANADSAAYGQVRLRLPQDPGQAGVYQAREFQRRFAQWQPVVKPISGRKGVRARGLQEKINSGNVYLLRAEWNWAFREELRKFREDEEHEHDDQVDAASDAYNELAPPPVRAQSYRSMAGGWV